MTSKAQAAVAALVVCSVALAAASVHRELGWPVGYEKNSAEWKVDALWQAVLHDKDEAGALPSMLAPLRLMSYLYTKHVIGYLFFWTEDLSLTFSWSSDTKMPEKHPKVIHPIGSMAKVKLLWDKQAVEKAGYTGLFKSDQHHALIRMGPAAAPGKPKTIAPGLSLKVLRDGEESANTVALYSLRGQGDSESFFQHTLCNHLSEPTVPPLSFAEDIVIKSFKTASKYPTATGLGRWAGVKELRKVDPEKPGGGRVSWETWEPVAGSSESTDDWKFPFILCFQPSLLVRDTVGEDAPQFQHVQEQLNSFGPNVELYHIYAAAAPNIQPERIGSIKLDSKFHKTKWGDQEYFVRHELFENDLKMKHAAGWQEVVDAPDYWFSAGATDYYNPVDFNSADKGDAQPNAWAGGLNPSNTADIGIDGKELNREDGASDSNDILI